MMPMRVRPFSSSEIFTDSKIDTDVSVTYGLRMERFELKVTSEQLAALKKIANGQPVSQLIRRAIDEFLERQEAKGKR